MPYQNEVVMGGNTAGSGAPLTSRSNGDDMAYYNVPPTAHSTHSGLMKPPDMQGQLPPPPGHTTARVTNRRSKAFFNDM